jgi:hypothetical protein
MVGTGAWAKLTSTVVKMKKKSFPKQTAAVTRKKFGNTMNLS